ncbi:MAG: hypothetical protein F6K42_34340, partial [Leptolyngbya sp. SIO1D8]|nr:hypothetical protein [Leptolyngbya sp. SIO1D8]
VAVDYPGRTVYARIWRVQVGTVPLYLLDTNIEPNNQYDQDICAEILTLWQTAFIKGNCAGRC